MVKRKNKVFGMFVVVITIAFLFMVYLNFQLSFKANHREDNLFLINQDLDKLGAILRVKQLKMHDFESLSDSIKMNYQIDEATNSVRFQLITISFDDEGNIREISH